MLLGTLASAPASAELHNELAGLQHLCLDAIVKADYDEATRVCRRISFDIGKLAPGSVEHVASVANIGDVKRLVANYVDADSFYEEALAIEQRGPRKDGPAARDLLSRIVEMKIRRGKYLDAEPIMKHLISLTRKDASTDVIESMKLRLRLADLESLSHQFPEAEQIYIEIVAASEKTGAAASGVRAMAVQHLAETYEREQKFQRAEAEYLQLLGFTEHAQADLQPPLKLSLPLVLDRVGFVVEQQGRIPDAVAYYRREMALLKTTNGSPEQIGNLQARLAMLAPDTVSAAPQTKAERSEIKQGGLQSD